MRRIDGILTCDMSTVTGRMIIEFSELRLAVVELCTTTTMLSSIRDFVQERVEENRVQSFGRCAIN